MIRRAKCERARQYGRALRDCYVHARSREIARGGETGGAGANYQH